MSDFVEINIAKKNFRVVCPSAQHSLLLKAADELNNRLNEAYQINPQISLSAERAAIMVALNLACELLELQSKSLTNIQPCLQKLQYLESRLEQCFFEQDVLF